MKTKIKSYCDEVTDFYDKIIHKVDSNQISLVVIGLDSAFNKDHNYYLQVFLKECKYIDEKVIRYINDNMTNCSFSDESDEE